jgi:hypothetical protein
LVKSLAVLFLVCAGIASGVLGYGWWHASTHATFTMDLRDIATPSRFENLKGAQLEFLDDAGKVLARGKTDDKVGVVWVEHPTAGYCGPNLAQAAYTKCFDAHSEWLLTWVPRAHRINLFAGSCRIERAPVYFSASRDSVWSWWVPLPHIGGMPYTNFNASLQIDGRNCAVVPYRG